MESPSGSPPVQERAKEVSAPTRPSAGRGRSGSRGGRLARTSKAKAKRAEPPPLAATMAYSVQGEGMAGVPDRIPDRGFRERPSGSGGETEKESGAPPFQAGAPAEAGFPTR